MSKLDLNNRLGAELQNIKDILQEATKYQADLITLTQEGDKI